MDLKAEKRTGVVLAVAALLIVILLPLLFRELEPDYQAAYDIDPKRKERFASKDEKPPELPNLPPSASASADAGGPARRGLQVSAHRALPSMGRVSAGEEAKAAAPEPEKDEAPAGSGPPAPRLVPTQGFSSRGAGRDLAGPSRAPGLDDARFGKLEAAPAPKLELTPGSAGAARMIQKMGYGDVPGLIAAAQDPLGQECAQVAERLKPRLAAATAEHRSASSALEASGCGKDSCGLYADDCADKERSPEESRVAARRCRCDKLACRKIETCRAVDKLLCEQQTACSSGGAASCVGSGCE
jgi:hypothetical protein